MPRGQQQTSVVWRKFCQCVVDAEGAGARRNPQRTLLVAKAEERSVEEPSTGKRAANAPANKVRASMIVWRKFCRCVVAARRARGRSQAAAENLALANPAKRSVEEPSTGKRAANAAANKVRVSVVVWRKFSQCVVAARRARGRSQAPSAHFARHDRLSLFAGIKNFSIHFLVQSTNINNIN